ncbi:J domain-containing protein [Mycoplasmoides gallisepticum]|uniref:DnaJ-like molecular chaperone n=3 Tax=Mycoplasmoides gallisepticum TaxID=2096 RepID=Q7NAD5_MYCGA|nr:J domain-containing protein [Mycoplasmoides gallisepticum]AAP57075.2 DnaJ-like molecular chaperone [Mycoplasmoides gallisepticum str. R(low)]ADC30946.1 DnaJ-like molecular chaperone [Mycoplasmoides gallisepticum str. R(high)]AFP76278.1 DnaJ-like molecular chaperone [Mycoplasmoides gallisepticum VA94_7994-1-7P]AFP77046.1 DnaJ-like molecular chaperone [Mycoplasmoides gallisepticum NC95_13295-2-2P]AFP77804.1 DnaJ-like molecular chaperone [Mycoplasmoides gallisepticum NC96_1596-4-2P]
MTLYELLEVDQNATLSEIKSSYKRLAKKYHPDVNKNGHDKFVQINNAYSILSDEVQREKYDFMLDHENSKTFEFSADGLTYEYSGVEVWHENFTKNVSLTQQWDFNPSNYYYEEYNLYHKFDKISIDGLGAFLDFDISCAFYELDTSFSLPNNLVKRLINRPDVIRYDISENELIEYLKHRYDFSSWLLLKKYFNIEAIIEVTQEEIDSQKIINIPIKIKVINLNRSFEIWHEELRNYAFIVPENTKTGDISEFFGKGNVALGWQGDLIVRFKVVPSVEKRLKIFSSMLNNEKSSLWFLVPSENNKNPNTKIFNYKTYQFNN